MSESTDIRGGCLCRSVRYRITVQPIATRLCWCRLCQYLAAGNATVDVVPTEAVSIEGELRDYRSIADSGNVMHRRFCPTCGTPIFSQAEVRPHLLIVRAGTLDHPSAIKPTTAIWTDSAPNWACFDPGLTQIPGQPPPIETWSMDESGLHCRNVNAHALLIPDDYLESSIGQNT